MRILLTGKMSHEAMQCAARFTGSDQHKDLRVYWLLYVQSRDDELLASEEELLTREVILVPGPFLLL